MGIAALLLIGPVAGEQVPKVLRKVTALKQVLHCNTGTKLATIMRTEA